MALCFACACFAVLGLASGPSCGMALGRGVQPQNEWPRAAPWSGRLETCLPCLLHEGLCVLPASVRRATTRWRASCPQGAERGAMKPAGCHGATLVLQPAPTLAALCLSALFFAACCCLCPRCRATVLVWSQYGVINIASSSISACTSPTSTMPSSHRPPSSSPPSRSPSPS